jgi:Na+/proline symporter
VTVFSIIGLVAIGVGFMGIPQIFVRFLALRDPSEVPKGAAVAITWTLLADTGAVLVGMVGRTLPIAPDKAAVELLGEHGEHVLPLSVEFLLPPLLVGLFIAIVLAAIMSTVDSLLVLAGSAAVRDAYQKVFRPHLADDAMVGISRWVTIGLALVALAIAMIVALVAEDRSIFWFVIFGWSGLAATFCPTVILSLFWPGLTRNGALASMLTGAVAVPVFAFAVPELPVVGPYFGALSELPPSFALAMAVAVVVSLLDVKGRAALADTADELREAGAG